MTAAVSQHPRHPGTIEGVLPAFLAAHRLKMQMRHHDAVPRRHEPSTTSLTRSTSLPVGPLARIAVGLVTLIATPVALLVATRSAVADDPAVVAADIRREPLSPQQALAEFEILPGLRVELAASEPQVIDPVSAAFDHLGRLWVVEMNDYPTGPKEGEGFNGRIKLLVDNDGDGYFETATVFADSLVFATGIQPFRDGVIATLAGEVAYLADTTGDGVCDTREVWFTGFSKDNEQLRANHPTWTIENEIHVASGLRGGEVRSSDARWTGDDKPISLSARDFRFSPFGGDWRAVAGNSQFGYYQDDQGRNFICSNRNPCTLLLAEANQAEANPLLPLAQWRVDVMPAAEKSEVFPLVAAWTTSNLHAGQFTAACGVYRYQSDRLAPWLRDDFFACEPTGSLVQRYRLTADGIVPIAERGRAGMEFLASRDPWFRPVDLLDGPDGSMYVIDMHRAVIEHPAWMPKELRERGDMRWGDAAGRIYRIVPAEAEATTVASSTNKSRADLATDDPNRWLPALASENRWARKTAGRRIAEALHQPDGDSVAAKETSNRLIAALRERLHQSTTQDGSAASSETLIRIVWLLQSNGELQAADLKVAAASSDPAVRGQAVRLLARRLDDADSSSAAASLLRQMATDPAPSVRYQWLLELAARADESWLDSLVGLLRASRQDSATDRTWLANAVSLTAESIAPQLIRNQLAAEGNTDAASTAVVLGPLVKRMGWAGSSATLAAILEHSSADAGTTTAVGPGDEPIGTLFAEYAAGLAVRSTPWDRVAKDLPESARTRLAERLASDRLRVLDESVAMPARVAAFRRVGSDRSPETLELARRMAERQGDELYVESLQILRHFDAPEVGEQLVSRLVELPPRAATSTVAAMIGNAKWTSALLDAIESQRVPWGLIDPTSVGRLERHGDKAIADRVKKLRAGRTTEDRQALIGRYQSVLAGRADAAAGKAVFVKQCAGCHRIDNEGVVVGPDISDMRTQTPEQILLSILDPNAAIDANYYRYAVLTDDGQLLEGLLEDSSQQSVVLKMQDGLRRTIPRDQIEQLRATGVSMMPEGFENQIDPAAMRDLIAYLKRWRLLSGEIPLGQK
ncbi:MAG: hypothetical protein EA381_07465 [Planctomycetaceae bacterium]|nr:MAG: hypothetical protein EA381_07465 [Planctomycetaceae bacterium]